MAALEIECADQTTVATAIAQTAFDPALAVAEEPQEQIEQLDGFRRVVCGHGDTSGSS
jgi:hypothetical protein